MTPETIRLLEKLLEANAETARALSALAEAQYLVAQVMLSEPTIVSVEIPSDDGPMTMQ